MNVVQAAQPRIDVVPAVVREEEGRRQQDTRSHGDNVNIDIRYLYTIYLNIADTPTHNIHYK